MKLADFFPLNAAVKEKDAVTLAIVLVIYILAPAIFGILCGILSHIPLLGWIFLTISTLVGIYALAGIVLAVFKFLGKSL